MQVWSRSEPGAGFRYRTHGPAGIILRYTDPGQAIFAVAHDQLAKPLQGCDFLLRVQDETMAIAQGL